MCGHLIIVAVAVLFFYAACHADSCPNRFTTNEFSKQLHDCIGDSDHQLDCLRRLLRAKMREKVLLKKIKDLANVTGTERDPECVKADFKNLLLYIDRNKKEIVKMVTGLLPTGGVSVDLDPNVAVNFRAVGNDTVDVMFRFANDSVEVERKMKMTKNNILAMLFTPAMMIAGIMPWILPGIKMAVMIVGMMNQMAFSSALFTLIRGYIFDPQPEEHIIYVNNGYKNYHHKYVRVHEQTR